MRQFHNLLIAAAIVSTAGFVLASSGLAGKVPAQTKHAAIRSPFPGCGAVRQFDSYKFQTSNPDLKALRVKVYTGKRVPTDDLRRLADAGDRMAAFRMARIAEGSSATQAAGGAIHYYSVAAYLGLDSAVKPLVGLLRIYSASIDRTRLANAERALMASAHQGNVDAMLALGTFYRDGAPFPGRAQDAFPYLCRAAVNGSESAALLVGSEIMKDANSTSAQRQFGMQLIARAARSGDLAAAAVLRSLEGQE